MRAGRFSGLRRVLRIGVVGRELDDELAFHFESTVEELMARGGSREEAEAEARHRFGNEREYRRELERIDRGLAARIRWRSRWEVAAGTIGHALRRMRRAPWFTAGVVVTFALGIGANATMFGIVDRLLLSPPAHVAEPDRVVRLMVERRLESSGSRESQALATYADYVDYTRAESFSAAAYSSQTLTVGRGADARQLEAELVTASYFPLLGVRPVLGRFFTEEEDRLGGERVAVISERLWRREYGADREVLGRTLDFGYGPYTIVGVAPEGFTGVDLDRRDVWLPLHPAAEQTMGEWWTEGHGWFWLYPLARIAPGVDPATAEAEATTLHRQGWSDEIEAGDYDDAATVLASPLIAARGPQASDESAVAKWLAGLSLVVLLIACANVANLLLARSVRQRREVGIRLALGSSRARVLGQVIAESLLLALLGGAGALLLTSWGGAWLRATLLPDVAWSEAVGTRVALFAAAATVVAGVVAGALPALQSSRPDMVETLKSGTRGASTRGARVRAGLTVMQAALSVVLLVGAGLFVRSLREVESLDLGLDPNGVALFTPVFDREMPALEQTAFFERAEERVRALPGVQHAAAVSTIPFYSLWSVDLRVPGLDSVPRLPGGGPYLNVGSPDYFDVLDLEIVRGRSLRAGDTEGSPRVAVVSELMARTIWPNEDPLGKCMIVNTPPDAPEQPCTTVVGVAEDARRDALIGENPAMQYYLPLSQWSREDPPRGLLVRVRGEPEAMAPALRRELLALDPALRYADVRPFRELIDPDARAWRLGATMFTLFGALALLVAAIGLYSVLSFSVAQRTFELGVRAALGATRERLLSLVLREAIALVAVGVALGLAAVLVFGGRLEPLLYGVTARDPWTLAVVAAALGAVAVIAGAIPALRATRVDPSEALRVE